MKTGMGKRNKKGLKLSVTIHLNQIDRVILGILLCFNLVSDEVLSNGKVLTGSINEASQIFRIKLSTEGRAINE